MKRLRIVLADDHALLVDAISILLEPEFEVVGTFNDGRALVAAVPALNPDIVVLDISMPQLNGLGAAQRLKEALPKLKIIFLTMNADTDLAAEAFRMGACGYVLKSAAAKELLSAIRLVARGRSYVTPSITQDMVGPFADNLNRKRNFNQLTLRQKEVLQLLAEGRSMKEVAHLLKVTPRTIAFHKYSMMEHLHLRSSAELIQFAVKSSLVASA